MYRYDTYDQKIVDERVAQFREQTVSVPSLLKKVAEVPSHLTLI